MANDIRSQVLHSLKWVALGKVASQIVRWLLTFWVIRLLTPEDYGFVAMAEVSFAFLTLIVASLFGPHLIQSKELTRDTIRQVFGMALAAHGALFIVQYSAAPIIGVYFNSDTVTQILQVNAVCFLFMALEVVPHSLLIRNMRFKQASVIGAISNSVAAVVTLVLAYRGYGFWALVYGEISSIALRTLLVLYVNPINYLPSLRWTEVSAILKFGSTLSVNAFIVYVFLHMDVAVAGRMMSPVEVGMYAIALQLAVMPQKKILPMLRSVAFPAFSRIQDNKEDISRYVLKAQKLCLLVAIPIFWGLASVVETLVPLILGEKWVEAVPPSQLILLVMPLRFCDELFNPALKSQRLVKEMIGNSLIATVVVFIAILIGSGHGATGLAMAWLAGYPIAFFLIVRRNARFLNFSMQTISRIARPPVLSGILMLLVVALVDQAVNAEALLLLSLQIAAGIATYTSALYLLDRESIMEVLGLIGRRTRKG